jgi:hypothetical protein
MMPTDSATRYAPTGFQDDAVMEKNDGMDMNRGESVERTTPEGGHLNHGN